MKLFFALISLTLIAISCQKEVSVECGKVIDKTVLLNIHGTHLEVDYGNGHVIRVKVDLITWSNHQVGQLYCN